MSEQPRHLSYGPNDTCTLCGQRVLIRHGIKLSPREADLFDLLDAADGRGGIDMDVLGRLWAGSQKTKRAQVALVKTTIYHINDKLASTNLKIIGVGKHPVVYHLFRQTP